MRTRRRAHADSHRIAGRELYGREDPIQPVKLELAPFDVAQGTPSEVEGRNRMNCSPSTRTPPSVDAMALS